MSTPIPPQERPLAAVLSDILGNIQDIIHSELRWAASGAREQLSALTQRLIWLGICVVGAVFALSFALWGAFFGLIRVVSDWAAALIVAAGMSLLVAAAALVYRAKVRGQRKRGSS